MKKEITQLVTAATLPDELTQRILNEFTPHAENVTALLADIEALGQDIEEEGGEINQAHADCAKKLLKRLTAIKGAADRSRKACGAPYHDTWKACNKVGNLFRDGLEKQKPNIERIAHHFILEEQRKRAKLAEERIAKMSPYKANAHTLDLELLDDEAFEMMLAGACALYTQRKAEAEAAHAADEAARKAKREAEIADAAARLVAERDAAAAAAAKTHTVHEESATPTLTDAELREIADNMQREITPDVGAVMLVSDAMKLIYEAYNIGFDDGSDACGGTPRYRTNEDVEAMRSERIIAHMNTIKHPAIVGYMQSENGLPTPKGIIMPKVRSKKNKK